MQRLIVILVGLLGVVIVGAIALTSKKLEELPTLNQDYFDLQTSTFLETNASGTHGDLQYEIKKLEPILLDNSLHLRAHVLAIYKETVSIDADITVQGSPDLQGDKFFFKQLEGRDAEFHSFKAEVIKEEVSLADRVKSLLPGNKDTSSDESKSLSERVASKVVLPNFAQELKEEVQQKVEETVENIVADEQLMQDLFANAVRQGFSRFPIYTLDNNIAESAIALAIDEVKIENQELVISISFWKIGVKIIGMIVLGIALIIFSIGAVRTGLASWFIPW